MHKQRIALLVLALVGIGGTFLPWFTTLGESVNGTVGDGWMTLGLYVPAVLMALVGNWKRSWQGSGFLLFAVPSLLASAVGIFDIANFYIKRGSGGPESFVLLLTSIGWGLYVVAAAGIVLVGFAYALQGAVQRKSDVMRPLVAPPA
jgi:hypothetical protein